MRQLYAVMFLFNFVKLGNGDFFALPFMLNTLYGNRKRAFWQWLEEGVEGREMKRKAKGRKRDGREGKENIPIFNGCENVQCRVHIEHLKLLPFSSRRHKKAYPKLLLWILYAEVLLLIGPTIRLGFKQKMRFIWKSMNFIHANLFEALKNAPRLHKSSASSDPI